CLNRCLTAELRDSLAKYATVGFVPRSVTCAELKNLKARDAIKVVQLADSFVAEVMLSRRYIPALRISNPALRVRPSTIYPDTQEVLGKYPGTDGRGVNIAFIDSGVDDSVHTGLHPNGPTHGFDFVVTGEEGNPDDDLGHGTLVAGVALLDTVGTMTPGIAP